jgi:hypothetical protein
MLENINGNSNRSRLQRLGQRGKAILLWDWDWVWLWLWLWRQMVGASPLYLHEKRVK